MSHISLENKKIISLDSIDNRLVTINNSLDEQSTRLNDQTLETKSYYIS